MNPCIDLLLLGCHTVPKIWLSFATWALGFNRLFPGLDCRLLTLAINFRNPLLHAYLLWNGGWVDGRVDGRVDGWEDG